MSKMVGIIGLGLIGGSFAKSIRARTDMRIVGFDTDGDTLERVLAEQVIDGVLDSETLTTCDFLIVALRPGIAVSWIQNNIDAIPHGCIIFDVAGVKREIVAKVGALCAAHGRTFVGAHPMAGYHEGGYTNASDTLFEGASFLICKDENTSDVAIDTLSTFAKEVGFGHVVVTTPENHDEMIAFTSQLAHIVSNAYIKDPDAQNHRGYSAGSFQDMTRVAILDADMWSELCIENADMLIPHIDTLIENLTQYREALVARDDEALRALLRAGVAAKRASIKAHEGNA